MADKGQMELHSNTHNSNKEDSEPSANKQNENSEHKNDAVDDNNNFDKHGQKFELEQDIYNIIAVLEIRDSWNKFDYMDIIVLIFFCVLVLCTQIAGFVLIAQDQFRISAKELLLAHAHEDGDDVYAAIIIADICLVLLFLQRFLEVVNIFEVAKYTRSSKSIASFGVCKLGIVVGGGITGLYIVSHADTAFEAMARAVEIFILVEISEWTAELLIKFSKRPEINHHVFDLTSNIEPDYFKKNKSCISELCFILLMTLFWTFLEVGLQTIWIEKNWKVWVVFDSDTSLAGICLIVIGFVGVVISFIIRWSCKAKENGN